MSRSPADGAVSDAEGTEARAATGPADLDVLRRQVTETDRELVEILGARRELVLAIGRAKTELGMQVLDPAREALVIRRASEIARERGIDQEMVRDVLWRVIASARAAQEKGTG
ncbi:MAG: chorismate mutase [Gemmatimonadetes bacterium]|nr:chorismate mutase [Gemmatimonadota bacterium]